KTGLKNQLEGLGYNHFISISTSEGILSFGMVGLRLSSVMFLYEVLRLSA
ncbi:hypothetical protein ACJX0J_009283, partial [Zea mays]